MRGLVERGAAVRAHDPEARHEAERHFSDLLEAGSLELCSGNYDCLEDADALVVLTEWAPYRHPDFERIRGRLRQPVIFDGRNLWQPEKMHELGFEYVSIGRAAVGSPRLVAAATANG